MNWKATAQQALARWGGRWTENGGAGRVVVLCYHAVDPQKDFATRPEVFKRHLDWLHENADVIRFEEALAAAGEARERPAVAITFDDGYADNYRWAYPALVRHSMPATFFLTAGLLEGDAAVVTRFVEMRGAGYEAIQPLDWRQAREMQRAGMTIGVHTYSHLNLAGLGRGQALREMALAREIVEQRLGAPARTMAYPYGVLKKHVTRETLELAEEAGYEHAGLVWFRAVRKEDAPLAIPRFDVVNDTEEVLWQKVRGWWDYLGWWQENRPAA